MLDTSSLFHDALEDPSNCCEIENLGLRGSQMQGNNSVAKMKAGNFRGEASDWA